VLLFAAQGFLEQRKENIFLIAKIGIKRAARLACRGGDVFQTGHFESIAGKNVTSCFQKIAPC